MIQPLLGEFTHLNILHIQAELRFFKYLGIISTAMFLIELTMLILSKYSVIPNFDEFGFVSGIIVFWCGMVLSLIMYSYNLKKLNRVVASIHVI